MVWCDVVWHGVMCVVACSVWCVVLCVVCGWRSETGISPRGKERRLKWDLSRAEPHPRGWLKEGRFVTDIGSMCDCNNEVGGVVSALEADRCV